jgi:hypothetical protein
MMIGAAIVARWLGIDSARRSLEDLRADPPAGRAPGVSVGRSRREHL